MRKTYTYKDELRAKRIGAIAGTLYVIAMFIWLVFDAVDYKTDVALSFLGQIFGPIIDFIIWVTVGIVLCIIIDFIKKLFVKFIKKMFPSAI